MYAQGHGVAQDYKEAMKWYRLAADQGFAKAQFNLGDIYDQGHGVAQDYKEAVKWYQLAAEQGLADAQYNLGGTRGWCRAALCARIYVVQFSGCVVERRQEKKGDVRS
jgi:uncharacterized protein